MDVIWIEGLIYGGFAVICTSIAFYFRFNSQHSLKEYTLGNGGLGLAPVTLSMIASTISSGSITTLVEEAYLYGVQYLLGLVNKIGVGVISASVIIPLFYKLGILLPYDYVELRFSNKVKTLMIANYVLCQTLETSISIYILSTFIQQAAGINLYLIQITGSLLCTFYTFLGGYKGIVWSDAVQAVIIFISMAFLVIVGFLNSNAASSVFRPFKDSGRFDVNMDLDPTVRLTLFSATFGKFLSQFHHSPLRPFYWQRLLSLGNEHLAKWANVMEMTAHALIQILSVTLAVLLYATFEHCDPVQSGSVKNYIQLPLYYAGQVGKDLLITKTVFILGIIAAGMSSISTSFNTMPFVLYQDVYLKLTGGKPTQSTKTIKIIVILFGCTCGLISLLFESVGPVREFYVTVESTKSINYSILLIGIFAPFVDEQGALWGGLVSFFVTITLSAVSRLARAWGVLVYATKELSVDECRANVTSSYKYSSVSRHGNLFYPFRITPFYYSLLSFVLTLAFAILVSVCRRGRKESPTKCRAKDLKRLVWHGVHRFIPRSHSAPEIPLI